MTLTELTLVDTITDANSSTLSLTNGPTFVSATISSTRIGKQTEFNWQGFGGSGTGVLNLNGVQFTSGNVVNPGIARQVLTNLVNASTDSRINGKVTATTGTGGKMTITSVSSNVFTYSAQALGLGDSVIITEQNPLSTNGLATILPVSGISSFTADYTISQGALDSGSVINSVLARASSPGQPNNVSDTSDDPTTAAPNDKTITTITASPSIEVTKTVTVTDNGDGVTGIRDIVQYTITVKNTGNITLSGLTVSDTLTDANSNTLSLTSGPSFSGANQNSAQGTLKVNETATYSALYIIEQSAVDTGNIINYAVATASSPGQSNNVSDTSDDGDDTDGNTEDDVTELSITPSPSIEITKTAAVTDSNGDGETGLSDVINYTFKIENKGNVTLTGLTISDTLTDGSGGALSLNVSPSFSSTTLGSNPGTLKVGEVQTYTAYHIISAATEKTPSVINSAVAIASSPGQTNNVSDTSDDGDDLSLIHI